MNVRKQISAFEGDEMQFGLRWFDTVAKVAIWMLLYLNINIVSLGADGVVLDDRTQGR